MSTLRLFDRDCPVCECGHIEHCHPNYPSYDILGKCIHCDCDKFIQEEVAA